MEPTVKTPKESRPPIIAVLGHVDHGKSTLLDFIRKSNIVEGEAGGITQHVAAYEVRHKAQDGSEKRITFIDTPGHAAFKSIRARGAGIADIAILVVSAEDGVKEQTLEALSSIKASGIPFLVAINKIDKPAADVERTKASLLEHGIYVEGMGGDVPWAAVSAKSGKGIPELLDLLLLIAEMEELIGNPDAPATGYVIEAHREAKRGIAATLIITDGSLKAGQVVRAGSAIAPLRLMDDQTGSPIKEASFSTPILVVGFDSLPPVGATFIVYPNKKEAEKARLAQSEVRAGESQHEASTREFSLPVVLKADVSGSLEALVGEIAKIGDEHAGPFIIQSGIGAVSENDVKSAIAGSGTTPIILGFGVGIDANAVESARQHGILIETYDIIYKLTERLEKLIKERAPKRTLELTLGRARVLKLFSQGKRDVTIGGSVQEGVLAKGSMIRVLRKEELLGTGVVLNIQSARQDVARIEKGGEFGAQIETTLELAPGDILESFESKVV